MVAYSTHSWCPPSLGALESIQVDMKKWNAPPGGKGGMHLVCCTLPVCCRKWSAWTKEVALVFKRGKSACLAAFCPHSYFLKGKEEVVVATAEGVSFPGWIVAGVAFGLRLLLLKCTL